MARILVYCKEKTGRADLERDLRDAGCDFEMYQDAEWFMSSAAERKPEVLVLYCATQDEWAETGIATLKRTCCDAKIIFATQSPGREDVRILEKGVFYYAGNASGEIIEAVKAALKSKVASKYY